MAGVGKNDKKGKGTERAMSKHVEMIIDYIVDGDDFQYNDNHGRLTRCGECIYADTKNRVCEKTLATIFEDDYCSKAKKDVKKP